MKISTSQVVKEDMAQLGIRKSSRLLPILSIFAVLLTVMFVASRFGDNSVDTLFVNACANIQAPLEREGLELSNAQRMARVQCLQAAQNGDRAQMYSLIEGRTVLEKSELLTAFSNSNKAFENIVADLPGVGVGFVKNYTNELIDDFGVMGWNLLATILLISLAASVSGAFGMIYRRDFWSWFFAAAAVLAAFNWWIPFYPPEQKIDGTSITIGLFALTQIAVLVLAFRLRRYSKKVSAVSAATHNTILALVMTPIGLAIAAGQPEALWQSLPASLSWLGHWFFRLELAFLVFVLYTLLRRTDLWNGREPKNIVVCLDGTTNTPDQLEFGRLAQTNVFKLFKMLKGDVPKLGQTASGLNASISKRYANKQIGLYYSGVGNRFEYNPIIQTLGGATGLGASDTVDRAYFDVMRLYRPGDRVYIFGFSRGAAIARLLARALDQRGAPRTLWTLRLLGRDWTLWESKDEKVYEVPIALLGCWDTVAAFGLAKNLFGIDFQKLDLFKDLTVPDNVQRALHAVALDERRVEFRPTLMEPDPTRPEQILEVWFSGDHANVGGGWATTKLSDTTLDFMLAQASSGYAHTEGMVPGNEDWGIYLDAINQLKLTQQPVPNARAPFALSPDPLGLLRQWFSAVYEYQPRVLPHHAIISETVFARMTGARPLYAPQSIFDLADELRAKRQTVNAAVERLHETGTLTAEESRDIVNFEAKLKLTRWPTDFHATIASDTFRQSISNRTAPSELPA